MLAAVVLPVLPDTWLGPWGVWNPRTLWLVVVFVCGLSFVAFIAMRVWGAENGVYLSGVLGGLVSSTAATVAFATRSKQMSGYAQQLAVGAGLASIVMVLRVALLTGVTNRDLLGTLAPFLVSTILGGVVPIVLLARRAPRDAKVPDLTNPFQLKTALKFAALYAAVLLIVEAARREFGSWGLIVAAILAGLADVDAITLALASSGLPPDQAGGGIGLAVLSNNVAKAAYAAWFGETQFRRRLLLILGAAFIAGGLALLLVGRGLRPPA